MIRPGGWLTLLDWCDDYLACKLFSVWLHFTDPAFYRTYSLGTCRSLLDQAGFVDVDAQRFRPDWWWGLIRLACRRRS